MKYKSVISRELRRNGDKPNGGYKAELAHRKAQVRHKNKAKTVELLQDWIPLIKTVTSDNGKEFARHEKIAEQLDIDFYFALPYHSWQRGANENLNGLVRQYFPKDLDFKSIDQTQIEQVIKTLNNRPRKRFGFFSPNQILAQKLEQESSVAFIT